MYNLTALRGYTFQIPPSIISFSTGHHEPTSYHFGIIHHYFNIEPNLM